MRKHKNETLEKRFLIIQTASIGDVILATPVIEKLHATYPNAQIDFLLKKGTEGLLLGHPLLRTVYVWDKKNRKYKNWLKIFFKIRKQQYDLVVNIQRFFMSGLLTVFSNAKITVGFSKNPLSIFFTQRFTHFIGEKGKPVVHETERNLSLITSFTDSIPEKPRLYPSSLQYEKVKQLKTTEYICIAPTSLWFTKQFPKEKWIEFVNKMNSTFHIYYLGSESDISVCNEIIANTRSENTVNLAGELSLLESAALMQDAVMNFVNDSSPMHLASSVNANITAIFCSTIPEFGFGPLSDNKTIVQIQKPLYCRPCGLHGYKQCPKSHFKCAFEIDTNILVKKIGI